MGVTFKFDARESAGRIGSAAAGLANRVTGRQQEAFREAAAIFLADQLRRFDANMGGAGDWQELAPQTVRGKGGDSRILYRTGGLRESLRPGGPLNVLQVTAAGFVAGTANPVARFHQAGTAHLPKRVVIGPPSPQARRAIGEALKRGVRDSIFEAFRRR